MAEYIGCRNCNSYNCKGCNIKTLETMLNNGKFDCLMNENRCINPSADVAPMRHGYWVIDDYNTRECHCSECEWPAPRDVYEYHREQTGYCPVCGAKMEIDYYE